MDQQQPYLTTQEGQALDLLLAKLLILIQFLENLTDNVADSINQFLFECGRSQANHNNPNTHH